MTRVRPFVAALSAAGLLAAPPGVPVSALAPAHSLQSAALPRTGSAVVAGQVVDATSGRPVGRAVVTLALGADAAAASPAPQPAARQQARRAVAVATADGRFVFRDVPSGTYSLTSTLNGYAPGALGRRRPGGPGRPLVVGDAARLTDVVIPMWRRAAIAGTVRDDLGEPAVGVAVWAMQRTARGGYAFAGAVESTDERGRYRLSNLLPGSYLVTIRSFTQSVAVSTVDAYRAAASSGTAAGITRTFGETGALQMQTAGLVSGDWQVSVSSGVPQPIPGPDGTLLMHPAVYYPQAASPSDATAISLAPGDERLGVDLTLPLVRGMRVSGTLRDPDGPASNHGLRLYPASPGAFADGTVAYATSDSAGRFAFLGVPAGAYVIRAYRVPNRGAMVRPLPQPAGGLPINAVEVLRPPPGAGGPALFAEVPISVGSSHADGLRVALRPGARLAGRVAFEGKTARPSTAQLERMYLSIRPLAGSVRVDNARVDGEGRFTTSEYPPGRYAVFEVRPPGPEWTLASVRMGGRDIAGRAFEIGDADIDDVVVTFTDTVMRLSGTVRAADGSTDPEATVVAFPAEARDWIESGMPPGREVTTSTSPAGAYDLKIPLPGDYLVVAVPPEIDPEVDPELVERFAPAAIRVSFAPGESKTLALVVGPR